MYRVDPNQVINGVDGELWFDGMKMAEASEFEANVGISYTDIPIEHSLYQGKKMTGLAHSGKVHLFDISDEIAQKVVTNIKNRKCPTFTIIGKVNDPDSIGPRTVKLYDVKLEGIPIMKWSRTAVGEYDLSFFFGDFEFEGNGTQTLSD